MSSIIPQTLCFSSMFVGLVSKCQASQIASMNSLCIACALIAKDEETLCNVARWFMKEFQFVTDGYRLFAALNRLCDTSNTWYNCGPSQKYILRQIKAMDYSLVGKIRNQSHFQEKAGYTTKDMDGNPLPASDLDIGLLILYGHILYAGKSYAFSISTFE